MKSCNFVLCPACDSPIQIIGLYKELKNSNHPYGKHYPKPINVGQFNNGKYKFCPYARKRRKINKESRIRQLSEFEQEVYKLIKENYDIICDIISKSLNMKISKSIAEEMLSQYIKNKHWEYPWTTIDNLPYMIAYLKYRSNPYGLPVKKNSKLYNAIKEKGKDVVFEKYAYSNDYERIQAKDLNKRVDIEYVLLLHRREVINNEIKETVDILVDYKDAKKHIFEDTIKLDLKIFKKMLSKKDKLKRNKSLLEISNRLM